MPNISKYHLSLQNIDILAKSISDNIKLDEVTVIFLNAKVGSGKTTFVQSMAISLGVNANVSSPTFSIMNVYEDTIFHYDLYNTTIEKFISLAMLDNFSNTGIHIVEWGDEILKEIIEGSSCNIISINIEFDENDENKRFYKVVYG